MLILTMPYLAWYSSVLNDLEELWEIGQTFIFTKVIRLVYLYTHWDGTELPQIVQSSLLTARANLDLQILPI